VKENPNITDASHYCNMVREMEKRDLKRDRVGESENTSAKRQKSSMST
jgi:hypothetical protein